MVGDGEWLRVGEAAGLLGVSEQTVRRYVQVHRLVARRLPGNHRRISRASVDALLEEIEASQTDADSES